MTPAVGPAVASGDLLRELAPQVLGAVMRRYGNFADAEDATQEALIAAATTWPEAGRPDDPLAWLIRVASRRMANQFRSDDARRRREALAASWSLTPPEPAPAHDDTLILMFMCCHPSLTPASAIPLTLRAVGGLTTREIAAAFLVPEATMAQRISRAKAKIKASSEPFALPAPDQRTGPAPVRAACPLPALQRGIHHQRRPGSGAHRPVGRGNTAHPWRKGRYAR